jgi:hypothetical protein
MKMSLFGPVWQLGKRSVAWTGPSFTWPIINYSPIFMMEKDSPPHVALVRAAHSALGLGRPSDSDDGGMRRRGCHRVAGVAVVGGGGGRIRGAVGAVRETAATISGCRRRSGGRGGVERRSNGPWSAMWQAASGVVC